MAIDSPEGPDGQRLTLGQHLDELRGHVFRAVLWIAVVLAICLCFQDALMRWATWPHRRVVRELEWAARTRTAQGALGAGAGEAARASIEARDRIRGLLRETERAAAIARQKLAQDPAAEAAAIAREQAALEARLDAVLKDLRDLASRPDAARALELGERRARLAAEARELEARSAALAALADDDARVPRFDLVQLRYPEGFLSYMKVALVWALFLASPFVARELWRFVAKGLFSHERHYVRLFAPLTYFAFVLGASFGYLLLIPAGLKFLASYPGDEIAGQFALSDYLSLFINFTLVTGLMFELPLVMSFLALLGLFRPEQYAAYRKMWILIAFVIAAVITPTPDPITQSLCAAPLIVLYEVGIWLSRLAVRRRAVPPGALPARTPLVLPAEHAATARSAAGGVPVHALAATTAEDAPASASGTGET